jgi:protein phosphatase PTC1
VFTEQEAIDLIHKEPDAQVMSKKLLVEAIKKGSTDNISVLVLIL